MYFQGFPHNIPRFHPGVQGTVRVLEYQLYIPSHPAYFFPVHAGNVSALEIYFPFGGPYKSQYQPSHGGFSAARLTNKPKGLSLVQRKTNAVHRLNKGPGPKKSRTLHGKIFFEIFYLQHTPLHPFPLPLEKQEDGSLASPSTSYCTNDKHTTARAPFLQAPVHERGIFRGRTRTADGTCSRREGQRGWGTPLLYRPVFCRPYPARAPMQSIPLYRGAWVH